MAEPLMQSEPTPRRRPQERVEAVEFYRAMLRGLASVALVAVGIVGLIALAMLTAFGPAAALVTVPNVVGQPAKDAQALLEGKHLKLTVANYEYTPDVKEGNIISISPYEGKLVRAGREVRATISRGSRTVEAPALVGLSLDEATQKLTELDLQVGTSPRQANDKADGTILRQNPAAGTVLARKTKVNLAVSGGPDFGKLASGGTTFLFRTLNLTVPQGKQLQMVSVSVEGEDTDESVFERMCHPGEEVKVDFYGPDGARVRVKIDDERVFSERL